jgi:hypothetical protein
MIASGLFWLSLRSLGRSWSDRRERRSVQEEMKHSGKAVGPTDQQNHPAQPRHDIVEHSLLSFRSLYLFTLLT